MIRREAFVPLVTYPDPASDRIASNAVAVARHLGFDLHALALDVDIPNLSSALGNLLLNLPEMIREAEETSRARGLSLLGAITAQAAQAEVALTTGTLAAVPAAFGEVAAEHARYYDLSLIGWQRDNQVARIAVEGVVFGSGRPALLLPDAVDVGPINHVAIAWDESRVAARALADAQPFLERAATISVVTVLDDKPLRDDKIGHRLARTIEKRGLNAEARTIPAEDCPIAETLQEHARESGAQLLVMGGYGHSRIRDFVLGGATRGVLSDLRLPVLLSH